MPPEELEAAGNGLDIEAMTPEQRKVLMDAIDSGADSVDIPGWEPTTAPAAVASPTPVVPPAVAPAVPQAPSPDATPAPAVVVGAGEKPKRPATYLEALDRLNTAEQKLQARDRLLNRINKEPGFAETYCRDRGIPIAAGQNPIVQAVQLEHAMNASVAAEEIRQSQYREATEIAATHADTVLSEYVVAEPLVTADKKWAAVVAELGNDDAKIQQYVNDPDFRKTVAAEGPKDMSEYVKVLSAVRTWMGDKDRKPLHKYLDFEGVTRRATPATAAPVVRSPESAAAQAEAVRLAAKAGEPQILPASTTPSLEASTQLISDILAKADRVGVDNLSKEERDRVHQFYAD